MPMTRVPYISRKVIERESLSLLADYEHSRGVTLKPPIPIEEILEKHLKLRIEFDDTHDLFGVPRTGGADADILGAIFFDENRIVIDESLDPEENPLTEGRYRFTLAHEGGHWRLHRRFFDKGLEETSDLHRAAPTRIICRSSEAKERIEWQADYFASSLLMPRAMVTTLWMERIHPKYIVVYELMAHMAVAQPPKGLRRIGETPHTFFFNRVAELLAPDFGVSTQAMRIRLDELGLPSARNPLFEERVKCQVDSRSQRTHLVAQSSHQELSRGSAAARSRLPRHCSTMIEKLPHHDNAEAAGGPQLREALDRIAQIILDGLSHGHFRCVISSGIGKNNRRNLVVEAGKSYKFTIPENELPH
jgi:Zn-dependent peptidase ImmA (M78 family)